MVAVETDLAALERRSASSNFAACSPTRWTPTLLHRDPGRRRRLQAQDWAGMLERMYLRYCERRDFKVELLEVRRRSRRHQELHHQVDGEYAYGFLRTETGIHRLVRKSPFDSTRVATQLLLGVRVPRGGRFDRHRHQSRPTCAPTPTAPRVRAASTSTRPTRRCASPTSPAASWCSARTTVPSTATATKPGRCCVRGSTRWSCASASRNSKARGLEERHRLGSPDPLLCARPVAHQDLRTNYEVGNTQAVLDGDLDDFIQASLKRGV